VNGGWHVSSAWITKKCSASAMADDGSSRKGHNSLSPVLVEYQYFLLC